MRVIMQHVTGDTERALIDKEVWHPHASKKLTFMKNNQQANVEI